MKPTRKQYHTLRFIFGDQLNPNHSWYDSVDEGVLYVLAEMRSETDYVQHHIQKICGFFMAMENFADELAEAGHSVLHLTLDETKNDGTPQMLFSRLVAEYGVRYFEYQRPDEYRVLKYMRDLELPNVEIKMVDTEHFLVPFDAIQDVFARGQHKTMEFFYRKMRKRFDILMNGAEPEGGSWNYDGDNRNRLKADDIPHIPKPMLFVHDVSHIYDRIRRHELKTIGRMVSTEEFLWPVSVKESQVLLRHFCEHGLSHFGDFQDAMVSQSQTEDAWSLYHSRLSFSINTKMLHPLEVIKAVCEAQKVYGHPLNSIEGFVRQILGWREYVRGVYWSNMPEYRTLNVLNARAPLPKYYWTGETRMNCMSQAINQSLDCAYAHHIQRLMVTGNFALLMGCDPDAVDAWYLGIYIDALEWVELPNTRGMALFADGGIVGTKPYVSGGAYINRMSSYCSTCHYNVKDKTEETACPFNALYWHFLARHRGRFEKNPRMRMMYRTWDKMAESQREAVLSRGDWLRKNAEIL